MSKPEQDINYEEIRETFGAMVANVAAVTAAEKECADLKREIAAAQRAGERDRLADLLPRYEEAGERYVRLTEEAGELWDQVRPHWPEGVKLGQIVRALDAGEPIPTKPEPRTPEPGISRVSTSDLKPFVATLREAVGNGGMRVLRDHFGNADNAGVAFQFLHTLAVKEGCTDLEQLQEEVGEECLDVLVAAVAKAACSRLQAGPEREV